MEGVSSSKKPLPLLVAERIDRIEPRGASGRRITEQDANRRGKDERDDIDLHVEVEGNLDQPRESGAKPEGEQDSDRRSAEVNNRPSASFHLLISK